MGPLREPQEIPHLPHSLRTCTVFLGTSQQLEHRMPYFLYLALGGWGTKTCHTAWKGVPDTTIPPESTTPAQHAGEIWGQSGEALHPNFLLQAKDLIPQALHSGVPSSASLQSGVLCVPQEAQRRGPERSEKRGRGHRDMQ